MVGGDTGTPGRTSFGTGAAEHRRREPATTGAEKLGLGAGDRIVHGTWGEGTVLETGGEGDEAEATVQFASVGRKRLLLCMAPLKRA